MENIRVIKHGEHYFKHADVVKVTTVDNDVYIGQMMPGEEDDPFIFELCLEDDSHMPFWEDNIADIEKANDKGRKELRYTQEQMAEVGTVKIET